MRQSVFLEFIVIVLADIIIHSRLIKRRRKKKGGAGRCFLCFSTHTCVNYSSNNIESFFDSFHNILYVERIERESSTIRGISWHLNRIEYRFENTKNCRIVKFNSKSLIFDISTCQSNRCKCKSNDRLNI